MIAVGLRLRHYTQLPPHKFQISRLFFTKAPVRLQQYKDARGTPRLEPGLKPGSTTKPDSMAERAVNGNIKSADPLVDNALSNRDQRKADWTILREMAKYLWPKVSR